MKTSSNNQMKHSLQALVKINKVEVPDQVYYGLLEKIKRQNHIPMNKVRAAAVALILVAAGSWYTINSTIINQGSLGVDALVEVPDNSLYGYLFVGMTWMKGAKHRNHKKPKQIVIERLQFNPKQVQQYEHLIDQHHSAITELDQKIKTTKNELYLQLKKSEQGAVSDSLIQVISDLRNTIEHVHFKHFKSIKSLCYPEQMEDYHILVKDLAKIFSRKPPRRR